MFIKPDISGNPFCRPEFIEGVKRLQHWQDRNQPKSTGTAFQKNIYYTYDLEMRVGSSSEKSVPSRRDSFGTIGFII